MVKDKILPQKMPPGIKIWNGSHIRQPEKCKNASISIKGGGASKILQLVEMSAKVLRKKDN